MSSHPPPPPPGWGPPAPWPGSPPPGRQGRTVVLVVGLVVGLVFMVGALAVLAFVAPGFLVDGDESPSSESADSESEQAEEREGDGPPDVEIPPPNAGGVDDEPSDITSSEAPGGVPGDPSTGPESGIAGDPEAAADQFLAAIAEGDAATVDALMCVDEQDYQYEEAVAARRELSLTNVVPHDSIPGGFIGDLVGPEGSLDGRLAIVPAETAAWCVDSIYVF